MILTFIQLNIMAAFEAVSKVELIPFGEESPIDIRLTKLPLETPSNTDFDPRDHRNPSTKIQPWMAYFNMTRSAFGPGVLAMPMAISKAGLWLGAFLTIIVGLIVAHTHLTLLWCLNEIARQLKISRISYRYGFRLAMYHGPPLLHYFGYCGPFMVALFMVLSQLSICTVFVLLTADNLRDIMDWETSTPALLALCLPYLILELSMKNIKIISYVSMGGNVLTLGGLLIVFYEMINGPRDEEMNYAAHSAMSLFFSFGIMLFNMSAVGVMLSCEKALKDPKILTTRYGVINIGIMVPTMVSTAIGMLGYWCFGTMEENILRSLPFDEITSQVAMGLYLIAVGLSFPLQCYPAIQIIKEVVKNHDPNVVPSEKSLKGFEYVMRPIFVLMTFIIAYFIPFQGPFVAFVGTLCTTLIVLIFPALMEIGVLYPDYYGVYNYLLVKDVIIVILSLFLWVVGLYLCASLIYIRLMSVGTFTAFDF